MYIVVNMWRQTLLKYFLFKCCIKILAKTCLLMILRHGKSDFIKEDVSVYVQFHVESSVG